MTIYAKYTINGYTITFDSNGGTAVTAISEDYGTAISPPVNPTRTGYTFVCWNDGEEEYIFSTMPAGDITLIAEWELINNGLLFTLINDETEYQVARGTNTDYEVVLPAVYNNKPVTKIADEGFSSGDKSTSITSISIPDSISNIGDMAFAYTRMTNILLPDSVTHIGSFAFLSSDLQTISISKFVITLGNHPFVECIYLSNISVDQDNPNFLSEDGVLFNKDKNELIVYPPAKIDTSYTVPETVTTLGVGAFNSSHNLISVTLPDSLSTINQYAFAFCINLVSIIIPESVTLIGEYAFLESGLLTVNIMRSSTLSVIELLFIYIHHPFHKCSGALVIYVLPDSYATYSSTNSWNELTIAPMPTVTFDTDGGTAIDDVVVLGNSAVAAPETPTKDGYTFVDWYVEDTFLTPYDFDTLLTADMTIYAKYTINQYTATFKDHDGTIIDTSTVDYLTPAVAPADPTRTGYTFSGWDVAFNTMTANIDVTATYTINNQNTITFDTNGGSAIDPIEVPYNTVVAEPTAPTQAGYFFDGWFSDEALTITYDFATLVTADATLYARWATDPACFIYTVNGSNVTITGLNAGYPSVINVPSTLEGKNVVAIGNNAFKDKTSIATVTIPSGVTSIGTTVFLNCTSLTSITVASTNPNYSSEGGVLFNKLKTNLIAYPIGNTATSYTVLSSVTAIIDRAFQQADNLIEVILPDNIITIGNSAFYHCNNLLGMDIPITVTSIGASAFESCIAFEEITFATGISLTTISMSTFRFSGLEQIIIPASVVNIFSNAFSICTSLNSVTFEAGSVLTNIYYDAFIGSSSLTSITLPNSVTTLYAGAFQATGLTSITLPSNITTIPDNLFAYCNSLASITIGANITSIGELAFNGNSLTEIIFEEGSQLQSIGFAAFYGNDFTTINLPSSLLTIGGMAFGGCYNMNTIVIPSSVTSIGNDCFTNNFLENIYIMRKSSDMVTSGGTAMFNNCPYLAKIYVHADSVAAYKAASGWSTYVDYIFAMPSMTFETNGGNSIDAIIDIPYGTAIAEPSEPTKLGFTFSGWYIDDSFSSEYDFATIVSADTIIYAQWAVSSPTEGLGYYYYDWTQDSWTVHIGTATDTDIVIPSTHLGLPVVNIGDYGFDDTNITSVTIGNGIKYIGAAAFINCANLTSINLPNTIESIGESAFTLTNITSIAIPDSVTYIGQSAFSDNSSLANVVLGIGLTSINDGLFIYCNSLTNIIIPESVTSIGAYAFYSCNLQDIILPYNLEYIGEYAFAFNYNLETIVIERPSSDGIITFGSGQFYESNDLLNIYVPDIDSMTAYKEASGWSDYSAIIGMPTVTFDLDGGSGIDTNVDVAYGTAVAQPANPTKSGSTFDGWYVDDLFSKEYDFATLITTDTTIYAKWL